MGSHNAKVLGVLHVESILCDSRLVIVQHRPHMALDIGQFARGANELHSLLK